MDDPMIPKSPLTVLSIDRYAGKTYVQETPATVDTTRVVLLSNNPNRLAWDIINTSLVEIRVSSNPGLTTATGFLLAPSGGEMGMTFLEDGEGVGYEIYAIGLVAGGTVWVREVIRS